MAQQFVFTAVFRKEEHTGCIFKFRKAAVETKGKSEAPFLVRNAG
jgi:hypothetical protein